MDFQQEAYLALCLQSPVKKKNVFSVKLGCPSENVKGGPTLGLGVAVVGVVKEW